jgi:small redox-active disulfide protein 2
MNIKILGTGCSNCQLLEQKIKNALEELKIEAVVEKVTEIQDIMSYGIMGAPALVIDEEVKVYGRVPESDEIKKILSSSKTSDKAAGKAEKGCCSCHGRC